MPEMEKKLNPIQTERLMRTFGGTLGAEATKFGGVAWDALFGGRAGQPARPARPWTEIVPGVRRFFARENLAWPRFVQQLDDEARRLKTFVDTAKSKEGSSAYTDYHREHGDELRAYYRIEDAHQAVTNVMREAKTLEMSRQMSPADKRKRMQAMSLRANEIARRALIRVQGQ
jgi:hypothetical protein